MITELIDNLLASSLGTYTSNRIFDTKRAAGSLVPYAVIVGSPKTTSNHMNNWRSERAVSIFIVGSIQAGLKAVKDQALLVEAALNRGVVGLHSFTFLDQVEYITDDFCIVEMAFDVLSNETITN